MAEAKASAPRSVRWMLRSLSTGGHVLLPKKRPATGAFSLTPLEYRFGPTITPEGRRTNPLLWPDFGSVISKGQPDRTLEAPFALEQKRVIFPLRPLMSSP